MQSACPSLVAVVDVGGDQVAQFTHFSVQEFLLSQSLERSQDQHLSEYHVYPQSAHAFFARACLCVLLRQGDNVDTAKIKKLPLASYAAKHWVDHAKLGCVSSDIQAGLMMKCLFDKALPHFKLQDLGLALQRRHTVARVKNSPPGTRCSPAVLRCAMWFP